MSYQLFLPSGGQFVWCFRTFPNPLSRSHPTPGLGVHRPVRAALGGSRFLWGAGWAGTLLAHVVHSRWPHNWVVAWASGATWLWLCHQPRQPDTDVQGCGRRKVFYRRVPCKEKGPLTLKPQTL